MEVELLCQTESAGCFIARSDYRKGCYGVVDTIQILLFLDNFTKPWSKEYNPVFLLTG